MVPRMALVAFIAADCLHQCSLVLSHSSVPSIAPAHPHLLAAGANMSGDLEDPGKSIGSGTLNALTFAIIVYALLIVIIGATVERDVLQGNLNIMQDVAFSRYIVAAGIFASTVSSALGNLVGSGRIMQALARDNVFWFLSPFKYGTQQGDEPILATLLAWGIAQACIFIGNLDTVASLISEFFLLVYASVNIACCILRLAGAPNFRPRFKYFSWHTALAGALACVVLLFLSSPIYAGVSIIIVILLIIYINYTAPSSGWGDVSQAIIFHQVRKFLLVLDERKQHVKNWRPSILLLVQHPCSRAVRNLIDFSNNLKKGGLFIIGSTVRVNSDAGSGDSKAIAALGDDVRRLDGASPHHAPTTFAFVAPRVARLRYRWLEYIDTFNIKAFAEVGVGSSGRTAAQNLTMVSGLGGMKPNTVILPFPEDVAARIENAHQLISTGLGGTSPSDRQEGKGGEDGSSANSVASRSSPAFEDSLEELKEMFPASKLPAAVKLALPQLDDGNSAAGSAAAEALSGLRQRRGSGSSRRYSRFGSIDDGAIGFWSDGSDGSALGDHVGDELDDEVPQGVSLEGDVQQSAAGGGVGPGAAPAGLLGAEDEVDCWSALSCSEDKGAKQAKKAKAMRAAASIMRIQRRMLLGEAPTADTPRLAAKRSSGLVSNSASAPTLPASRLKLGQASSDASVSISTDAERAERQASHASLVQEPSRDPNGVEMSTVMSTASDEAKSKEDGAAASDSAAVGASHAASPRSSGNVAMELLRAHRNGLVGPDGKPAWQPPLNGAFEFCGCLRDTLRMGRHALIARNFEQLNKDLIVAFKKHAADRNSEETRAMRVDVWLVGRQSLSRTSSLSLALQLATVLRRTELWSKNTTLRVVRLVESLSDVEREGEELKALLDRYRFEADVLVLPVQGGRMHPIAAALSKQMKGKSGGRPGAGAQFGSGVANFTGLHVATDGALDGSVDGEMYLSEHPAVVNEQVRYNCVSTCVCFMALPAVPGIEIDSTGATGSRETPTRRTVAEDAAYL